MSSHRGAKTPPARASARRGPLAEKVVAALQKLQRQQVLDLTAWRQGKAQAEALQRTVISQPELAELDPLHALYVYGQNQLSVMIEQLAEFEAYSANCSVENWKDAAVHATIYALTSQARWLMEKALDTVVSEHEG